MSSGILRRADLMLNQTARQLQRRVDAAHADGLEAAARIEFAAYATHVALHHVARLSNLEAQLIQQAPLGEARYKLIVDTFTGVAGAELASSGLGSS